MQRLWKVGLFLYFKSVFFNYFNILILKTVFKNKKTYYFNLFKKYLKNNQNKIRLMAKN